jgi:hypothetical protein
MNTVADTSSKITMPSDRQARRQRIYRRRRVGFAKLGRQMNRSPCRDRQGEADEQPGLLGVGSRPEGGGMTISSGVGGERRDTRAPRMTTGRLCDGALPSFFWSAVAEPRSVCGLAPKCGGQSRCARLVQARMVGVVRPDDSALKHRCWDDVEVGRAAEHSGVIVPMLTMMRRRRRSSRVFGR